MADNHDELERVLGQIETRRTLPLNHEVQKLASAAHDAAPVSAEEGGREQVSALLRMIRFGPALYRAARKVGMSRRLALFTAVFPLRDGVSK